ncbi:MAG: hypothetical protein HYY16_02725 [Planctomycetes bacterium]|nr:hypothetical protein [Planctomycetota bacterium]
MANIQFDKPRSITPEAICRELRESRHCNGMEILLWDEEITVEDRKSGAELTIKLESSKVQLEAGASKKDLAEKIATALVGLGLRRRGAAGAKAKKPFRPLHPQSPAAAPPATPPPAPPKPPRPT